LTFYCPLATNSVIDQNIPFSIKFGVPPYYSGFEFNIEYSVFQRTDQNDLLCHSNPEDPNEIDIQSVSKTIKGKTIKCIQNWKLATTPLDLSNSLVKHINSPYFSSWEDMIIIIKSVIIDNVKSQYCFGTPTVDIISLIFESSPSKSFSNSALVNAIVNGNFTTYKFDLISGILIHIFTNNKSITGSSFIHLNPQKDDDNHVNGNNENDNYFGGSRNARINPPVRRNSTNITTNYDNVTTDTNTYTYYGSKGNK